MNTHPTPSPTKRRSGGASHLHVRELTVADYISLCAEMEELRAFLETQAGIAAHTLPRVHTPGTPTGAPGAPEAPAHTPETPASKRVRLISKHPALGHALHWLPDTVFDMVCGLLVEVLHVSLQASGIWLVAVEHWSVAFVPILLVVAVFTRTKLASVLEV